MRIFARVLPLALAATLFVLVSACNGGVDEPQSTPSLTAAQPSPTPEPTPEPTVEPTPTVEKPDPQTLVPAGYVLDQVLEASLDGSELGQIVVISHTVRAIAESGDPTATTVPPSEGCPTDPFLDFDPSACVFRAEVFTYDLASGWISRYVTPELPEPTEEREKGDVLGYRAGIQSLPEATSFKLEDDREALVLTFHYCTGVSSGCGSLHEVLTMKDGEVEVVHSTFQAGLQLGPTTATFNEPEYAVDDPLCCPSARRIRTIGLDPNTGEVGVIDVQIEPVGP
ncbi:MAG: hypothetical protein IIC87_03760 [Chloroflexi bacterium]|nr:hypothetical protein [Chloroflexota bacterium]